MTIVCPVHGITDGYDARGGYFSKCRLCTRERVKQYKAAVKASGGVPSKRHFLGTPNPHPVIHAPRREAKPKTYVIERKPHGDPWLTCNQPECGMVCADIHALYLHKRTHSAAPEPEPQSLLQSTLRDA